jgi:hypothetical protein
MAFLCISSESFFNAQSLSMIHSLTLSGSHTILFFEILANIYTHITHQAMQRIAIFPFWIIQAPQYSFRKAILWSKIVEGAQINY